jgi:hypothetical protein
LDEEDEEGIETESVVEKEQPVGEKEITTASNDDCHFHHDATTATNYHDHDDCNDITFQNEHGQNETAWFTRFYN